MMTVVFVGKPCRRGLDRAIGAASARSDAERPGDMRSRVAGRNNEIHRGNLRGVTVHIFQGIDAWIVNDGRAETAVPFRRRVPVLQVDEGRARNLEGSAPIPAR